MRFINLFMRLMVKVWPSVVAVPISLYFLSSALQSLSVRMPWLVNAALAALAYGVVSAVILAFRITGNSTARPQMIATLAEFGNSVALLALVSGPVFGRPFGGLGFSVQFDGFAISEVAVDGNVVGLVLIIMFLKLSPTRRALAQLLFAPNKAS